MKKIVLLISIIAAALAFSCTRGGTNTNGDGSSTSSLVGTTWKAVLSSSYYYSDNEYITITFSTPNTGTGARVEDGKVDGRISFTYTMTSASEGNGTMAIVFDGSSVAETTQFSFFIVVSEMYVNITKDGKTESLVFKKVS